MAENRCSCGQGTASANGHETVCIDTMRVLDSCRDRDCYEDISVYLTPIGREAVERTATVRTTCAKIIGTAITVSAVPFNSGFYQINVRFYIRLKNEACFGSGCSSREFASLAILDKSVVLYGGEGSTTVFRSCGTGDFCSTCVVGEGCENSPTAAVETVAPIVLATRVACCDNTNCCSCSCECHNTSCACESAESIPCSIAEQFDGALQTQDGGGNRLLVSIGLFSVVRLERPAQFLISAGEYSVPDKECCPAASEENPCCLFRNMAFPTSAFTTSAASFTQNKH